MWVSSQLAETDYEVSLNLEGKADDSGNVLFAFELTFAGVFRVQNVPPQTLQPLVMIECPRLLFPFAREIIATAVRNGGFPPLLLDPVDFVALYQQRVAQQQERASRLPRPADLPRNHGVGPMAAAGSRYSRQTAFAPSVDRNARWASRSSAVSRGASGCGRTRTHAIPTWVPARRWRSRPE